MENKRVSEFLDFLTDWNYHTERVVVEAIIDGREELIRRAVLVWLLHMELGHMPMGLAEIRKEISDEIERKKKCGTE